MRAYIMRRVLISIPLLLAITFFTFLFIHIAPGDFFDTLKLNPQISLETIERYESMYGLDKPIIVQYIFWLKNLLKFDLGYSFFYNCPVKKVISARIFNTFILSISALLFTWLVAIPLGIVAALKQNRSLDRIIQIFSFSFFSTPSFFLALIALFFASLIGIFPLGGMKSANFDSLNGISKIFDILRHLFIPTVVISLASIGYLQRIMRANLLDVLRKHYILTARAKGIPENRIVYVHALRNAVNPLITIFGYELSGLLSGVALVEIICNWPGLGQVMLTAVRAQDIFLVMASALIAGVMLIFGNLIADVLLAVFDPRIRYE